MGMRIDDNIWEWEWERKGITLYGNGNDPYSHGNKFPCADAVFSSCNSNVQFFYTMAIACNIHYTIHTGTHTLHNND